MGSDPWATPSRELAATQCTVTKATKNLSCHPILVKAVARRDATGALEEHNESEISYCACA